MLASCGCALRGVTTHADVTLMRDGNSNWHAWPPYFTVPSEIRGVKGRPAAGSSRRETPRPRGRGRRTFFIRGASCQDTIHTYPATTRLLIWTYTSSKGRLPSQAPSVPRSPPPS